MILNEKADVQDQQRMIAWRTAYWHRFYNRLRAFGYGLAISLAILAYHLLSS